MKTVMLAAALCAANTAWADTLGTLTGQSFSVDYTTYTHCVQIGCPNEPPPQIDGDSVLWPISYFIRSFLPGPSGWSHRSRI